MDVIKGLVIALGFFAVAPIGGAIVAQNRLLKDLLVGGLIFIFWIWTGLVQWCGIGEGSGVILGSFWQHF